MGEYPEIGYLFVQGPEDKRAHYLHLVRLGDSNTVYLQGLCKVPGDRLLL